MPEESVAEAHSIAGSSPAKSTSGWRELWLKEDWWSIWLGLGLVLASCLFYTQGLNLKWIAVTPARWSTPDQLAQDVIANAPRYVAQFISWLMAFSIALKALGFRATQFVPGFILLYVLAVAIFAIGQWDQASSYNLEPPLLALLVGLVISNLVGLPRWLDDGFRVEFYVKIGIVLLGATLPVALIVWAGPVAMLQASTVSVATFLVIFWASRWFGLDRRLAATLAAGGAVCGVSAAIAISSAVGAKKQDTSIAITTVIVWAIVMIFVLPLVARVLGLHAGVAGAWIGTSEFADAAGFAAAQAYGNLVGNVSGIAGSSDQTLWAFTLMKVVGRDVWIGIWAFVLAIIATTRWDVSERGCTPNPAEIWWRFPKFVLGFAAASLVITFITWDMSLADYNRSAAPFLVTPLKDLRSWAFIFSFLSIGLTTRFKELAHSGLRPFGAFSIGVVVNVTLGFVLSTMVFAPYWQNLTR